MHTDPRVLCRFLFICILSAAAVAQSPTDDILANQNRTPAGKLENGVLTVHLEIRKGTWHAEAEGGPKLFVQAFGEAGQAAQIPGPLLRMKEGTTLHVTVTNQLKKKATVYGLNTRPGDPKTGIELKPDESRDLTFIAGAPGTYFYWARTVTPDGDPPYLADAQLNGAYIVDPAGNVPADRILVINTMFVLSDAIHPSEEVVSINGKSYPYTEPLEYTLGDTIRWRVINASPSQHPMHLHGSFYQLLSLGDFESDMAFAEGERESVVTQDLMEQRTMMMEWKPQHVGQWLFHCHFGAHISAEERVPIFQDTEGPHYNTRVVAAAAHEHPDSMADMNNMAGLLIVTTIKPRPGAAAEEEIAPSPHKFDLVIEPTAASGKLPTFSCSVREGKKIVASADKAMGPSIVVTRGEPTEITITNHLSEATAIHWHGLEPEAYYDGVIGGGSAGRVTPAILPGGTFVARFTPNRAGTFIYHTHAADPDQLSGGIYGALIVLEPGERFDPEHDKLVVIGSRDPGFFTKQMTINGELAPGPLVFKRGVSYRLRLINIAANLAADFQLGPKDHPATWRAIAKDGAVLPPRLAKSSDAVLHCVGGDLRFRIPSGCDGRDSAAGSEFLQRRKAAGEDRGAVTR